MEMRGRQLFVSSRKTQSSWGAMTLKYHDWYTIKKKGHIRKCVPWGWGKPQLISLGRREAFLGSFEDHDLGLDKLWSFLLQLTIMYLLYILIICTYLLYTCFPVIKSREYVHSHRLTLKCHYHKAALCSKYFYY